MHMTKDFYSGLFALIVGIAYLLGTVLMAEAGTSNEVGPRVFPYITGSAATICGIAILIRDIRSKNREAFSFNFSGERHVWIQIAILAVLGILYGKFLETLGYVIATFIFLTCAFSLLNRGRHGANLIYSAGFSLVTYTVFAILLELSLPRGLLDFLPF